MTYITIEKDKIEQVIQWAEKHGEIVFAGGGIDAVDSMNVFVESLRRSVAKAEKQEPVAWKDMAFTRLGAVRDKMHPDDVATVQRFLNGDYTHPQPEAEKQEPLFWYRPRSDGFYEGPIHNAQIETVRQESGAWKPLYTHPQPKREWVGLTGQQKNLIARISVDVFDAIHRSAAKLKELNT